MLGKTKNRYPTNVNRNNYVENRKNSEVLTPTFVANKIFEIVNGKLNKSNILIDVGCNNGNLSFPFSKKFKCIGYDKKKVKNYHGQFFQQDFLTLEFNEKKKQNDVVVICNPPFNDEDGEYGRKLLPELFFKKILELYGNKVPIIFFQPMGFLKNQRLSSERWKFIRDCGAEITSELELPIDAYNDSPGKKVLVHSSVLFFNIKGLKARYFL